MFCPNCSAKSAADQKFCRGCGLKLDKVSLLIVEQLPAGSLSESTPEEITRLLKSKQRIERLLVGIGLIAGSVFVLAITLTIIFKLIIGKGAVLQGAMFLGLIIAAVVALALVRYRESVLESLARRGVTDGQPTLPAAAPTTNLLPEALATPVGSVTDRTTELLEVERKRNTLEV
jgi:hypothetical protein